ncbi:hypothetical protein SAMN05446935_2485 [Burkholderia sp. YR290]|nr:hypothetical protein SAMN05446935_2485 [Burkholderia sp. YR290]
MDRHAFLEQRDMKAFVGWLAERLPRLEVRLRFPHSQFVPGGIDAVASGIEETLARYRWSAMWKDSRTGDEVRSCNWASTRRSLERLSDWLRESVANGDELAAQAAAREVLRWGGVRSAIPFIEKKVRKSAWCAYLNGLAPLFVLDGDQTLDALDARKVERFDAGLTKIHALLDTTGSPIYDSRVGAALAMLYEMFRRETGIANEPPVASRFPSGQARGRQIRNPGDLGLNYAVSPQFYTQISHEDWARWQLRAGWIIREVLERTTLFANAHEDEAAHDIAARCHAFEAALFMVGYDLRSLVSEGELSVVSDAQPTRRRSTQTGMWVPTGHVLDTALKAYLEYREVSTASDMDEFEQWLANPPQAVRYQTLVENFASYRFPLGQREMDITCRSREEVRKIASGVEEGLYLANNGEYEFIESDEREQVCLVCAGLAGYCQLTKSNVVGVSDASARVNRIKDKEFAGTGNTAQLLLTTGRMFGKHFGLLDKRNQPTAFFHRFYGDGFEYFRNRLGVDREGRDTDPR